MAFTNVITNTDVRLGNNEYEKGLTILTGQDLAKGSVLGIVTVGDVSGVFTGTGDPTIGAIVTGSAVVVGDYIVDFSAATAFDVIDPNGVLIGSGATGSEFSNNHLTFTITAGTTPADATTVCTITVAEGSGKLKLTNKASVDGSENARYVLQTALNTSATGLNADTAYDVIKSGKVRGDKLVFGGASVVADHREQLRDYGILVEDVETIGLD